MALMADVGTIQRLPKLVGNDSLLREFIFTARKFNADEACSVGMVRLVCSYLVWSVASQAYPSHSQISVQSFSVCNIEKTGVAWRQRLGLGGQG